MLWLSSQFTATDDDDDPSDEWLLFDDEMTPFWLWMVTVVAFTFRVPLLKISETRTTGDFLDDLRLLL